MSTIHARLTHRAKATLAELPEMVAIGVPSLKFFQTCPNRHIRVDLCFHYEASFAIHVDNGISTVRCECHRSIEHRKRKYLSEGMKDFHCHALALPDFAVEIAISNVENLARDAHSQVHSVQVSIRKGAEAATHIMNRSTAVGLLAIYTLAFSQNQACTPAQTAGMRPSCLG